MKDYANRNWATQPDSPEWAAAIAQAQAAHVERMRREQHDRYPWRYALGLAVLAGAMALSMYYPWVTP